MYSAQIIYCHQNRNKWKPVRENDDERQACQAKLSLGSYAILLLKQHATTETGGSTLRCAFRVKPELGNNILPLVKSRHFSDLYEGTY